MDYRKKYHKYKDKYLSYKNIKQIGGAMIVGTVDINTIVRNILAFKETHPDFISVQTEINKVLPSLDIFCARKYSEASTTSYKKNRYDGSRNVSCENNMELIENNADDALDFMKEIGKIYKNILFSKLDEKNVRSTGTTEWTSFNWVIVNENGRFAMYIGDMNSVKLTELGVKHTMLGIPNDLYFAGEGRIIDGADGVTRYIQFNLSSSSWDTNGYMTSLGITDGLAVKKYFGNKVKSIMTAILDADTPAYKTNKRIQVVEIDYKVDDYGRLSPTNAFYAQGLYRAGLESYDTTGGLLYYYNEQKCPDDKIITDAIKYKIANKKMYEITPKFKKDTIGDIYMFVDDLIVVIKKNAANKPIGAEYINNVTNLSI